MTFKEKLYEIIFEAETKEGRLFDLLLIISVLINVLVVTLESVSSIEIKYGSLLRSIDWFFTIIFTIEYGFRLYCATSSIKYAKSFFGIIDLLAIIPTYVSLIIPGSRYFLTIRTLRVLRIFRILKLSTYIKEMEQLMEAIRISKRRIIVFLLSVLTLVSMLGSTMYVVEGATSGFTSIPKSIYWAIVTLTTVGYGDISPQTSLGQMIAAILMILGYSLIVVPTGFVSVSLKHSNKISCPHCNQENDKDSQYCKICGKKL